MQDDLPLLQATACLTERTLLENADFFGVESRSIYVCKSKRAMKPKEAYKLPHRLVEKKRRDRINECISQLKDLLPEHLKLTSLGHLEKAVVLELTLKHLKALTTLTEQQHQKIITLQNGDRALKGATQSDLDAFHLGFQTCAREVLQHLTSFENWTPKEQLIGHLHRAVTHLRANGEMPTLGAGQADAQVVVAVAPGQAGPGGNCVPVIQRTQVVEHTGSDTDTDSGYGGEGERGEGRSEKELTPCDTFSRTCDIKQETDDRPAKRVKVDLAGHVTGSEEGLKPAVHPMMGIGMMPTLGQQPPFCVPFYLINSSAAAPYVPFLDKANLDRCWYPAPIPVLYPGIPAISALPPNRLLCQDLSPGTGPGLPPRACGSEATGLLLPAEGVLSPDLEPRRSPDSKS
ncbi:class E basic helix-loop-helix protein 41 [Stegostoma tigrinum]|uniref:class E basic helix-loop-helix protein 41 n=1 Tax=Stegostoma tigrinum TaxID=3053191 RepID=UPI00202B72B3|nr:class E basic helix-loop-helix protein 41 [Stegostoma tigrinum]XP_048409658.1 class E basic helix-loop-helix protein 41 [Stegostoma tigrinum]XP_048409661.1 class E basic helix-loop-helix protein 41 [Stegostoma tigrinum]